MPPKASLAERLLIVAIAAIALATAAAFVVPTVPPRQREAALAVPVVPFTTTTHRGLIGSSRNSRSSTALGFWKGLGNGKGEEEVVAVEEDDGMDEDEREAKRLRELLDKRLVLAAGAMQEDWPAYAFLLGVQALPVALGGQMYANFLYFWLTACTAVYLGAKRCAAVAKAGEVFQSVNTRNALFAPLAASVSLFGTYFLLKNNFDIATVYQLMTTAFGWYCLRDVLISLLLALNPSSTTGVPAFIDEYAIGGMRAPEEGELNGVKLAASGLSAVACATYLWGPTVAVAASAGAGGMGSPVALLGAIGALLAANLITSGIALQAQASIPLKSLQPAILFLTGLFLYDIFFVFLAPGSVMESVATSLEGPVKLLSPRAAGATVPGQYPFSILGLGDIVVPGLFVGLLKRVDEGLDPDSGSSNNNTFFRSGLAGYAMGLLLTFSANIIFKTGQPALLYIVPSLILSSLATGAFCGQLAEAWEFNAQTDRQREEGREA